MAGKISPSLIGLNAVSVLAYLLWIGYQLVKSWARAMGSTNSSSLPPDPTLVFGAVAVASLACVVYSFRAPEHHAKFFALAPIVLIGVGQIVIEVQVSARRDQYLRAEAARRAACKARLAQWSQDYVYKDSEELPDESRLSFLTQDKESRTIIVIDVGNSVIRASGVGRIDGDRLEIGGDEKSRNYYRKYVDKEGKSLFDRYRVDFNQKQDPKIYPLEKYN